MESIVVGAGIAGAVVARRLAEEQDRQVLVVERRQHVGGYCFDERNEEGIIVHWHGPHIFRTNSKEVWEYLSRFTRWCDYQHKVLSYVNGQFYPMPINLDTVNRFLGTRYTFANVTEYFEQYRTHPKEIKNVKDAIESQIGPEFYHAFYEKYTEKQWGLSCEELSPEVVARIPIRQNRDDRYFTHKYQALPLNGYTKMIEKMLDHPNIHVLLNTDFKNVRENIKYDHLYYSGSIDEYYDRCFGALSYRCVRFEFETLPYETFQPAAVVNYPNNYDYTRITEFKHFYRQISMHTVIAKEYPSADGDPSYPIPISENKVLYKKYMEMTSPKITFIGRLGEYRYYSMDQIVEKLLKLPLK